MNGLISLCLLVVVGCVSAELSQFGPRRPSNHRSSKESAEKAQLPNGGALAKPQNGAAQAAGQPARASSATSRPNRLPAKKRSSHSSVKLTASAQPGLSRVNNSTLSQSSEEVHSVKEREHSHSKTQHDGQHHSKGKAGQPAGHARGSALPSAGPALPPSSSNSTNKTNGSSVASPAASGKHSSKESSEEGDSHSSEESAKKHRPSKSDGGHSHKDSGHSQDGADTKLTQAILKQILKGEPVKVKVEKKAKIFFEREKENDSSGSSSSSEEKKSHSSSDKA